MPENGEKKAQNGQNEKAPTVLERWQYRTVKVDVLKFPEGRPFIQIEKGTQDRETGEWKNDRIRIRNPEQAIQLSDFLEAAAVRLDAELPGAIPKHEVYVPVKQEAEGHA